MADNIPKAVIFNDDEVDNARINEEPFDKFKVRFNQVTRFISVKVQNGARTLKKALLTNFEDDSNGSGVSSATDSGHHASLPPTKPPKPSYYINNQPVNEDLHSPNPVDQDISQQELKSEPETSTTTTILRKSQKQIEPALKQDLDNQTTNSSSSFRNSRNRNPELQLVATPGPETIEINVDDLEAQSNVSPFRSSQPRQQGGIMDDRIRDFYSGMSPARPNSRVVRLSGSRFQAAVENLSAAAGQIRSSFKNNMPFSLQNETSRPSSIRSLAPSIGLSRYSRSASSFAIWQISRHRLELKDGIHWNGDQKHPYFSYGVIFITGIILFAEIAKNDFQIENFSDNATLGPSKEVLLAMGAKRADLIIAGDFYRVLGAWWLHGGILHWGINMIALRNLGFSMEREFGTPKIAIIYCWSGIAGVLGSCVFLPNVIGVGASGAIFGLFGASWADVIQNYGIYKTRKENTIAVKYLTIGTIVNIILGLVPMIDQFAHMSGLFTGLFLGFFFLLQQRYTRQGVEKEFRLHHNLLRSFGLSFAIMGPLIMLIVLYIEIDPSAPICHWCEDLDCAPIDAFWFCDASGCSDESSVQGFQFPNGSVMVTCPSFVGKNVTAPFSGKAEALDVIRICRDACFSSN